MIFSYGGRDFKIRFEYPRSKVEMDARAMYCHIEEAPGMFVANGWATCVAADVFVKETGRKIALARALAHSFRALVPGSDPKNGGEAHWEDQWPEGWDRKEFRTAAWKAYLGRKKS